MTYDYPTTELGMIEDAYAYLLANGGTAEELATNRASHARFSRRRPDRVVTDEQRRPGTPNPRPYTSTVREAVLGDHDDTPADPFPAPVAPARRVEEPVRPQQLGLVNALTRDIERMGRGHMLPDVRPDTTWTKVATSAYINGLRAIIAATDVPAAPEARPVPVPPADDKRAVWAEWRALAADLVAMGGQHGARFAIDTEEGATNGTAFWWIVPGRDGRFWLRQLIGGHDNPVRVRMSPEAQVAVARKIMADPKEAMLRYGRELGRCGHCFRTLTNDESRALGIGPVCRRGKSW